MAITVTNSTQAWQLVKVALLNVDPGVVRLFKELKAHLAQIKGNPQLQFVPITDAGLTTSDGVIVADAACKLYAAYMKKDGTSGTGTNTDAYFKLFDDAANDDTASEGRLVLPMLTAARKSIYMDTDGLDFANGVVASSHTTYSGTTDTTAGDAGNGFALIGLP